MFGIVFLALLGFSLGAMFGSGAVLSTDFLAWS
jgi:hypothetical protein